MTERRPGRDPFLDVVRSIAMVCVVLNHYTFSHVWPGSSFAAGAHWKFVQVEGQPWVTWPFVFELAAFFFVGGATVYRSALNTPYWTFAVRRGWRLLLPVPFVVAVALLAEGALTQAGMGNCQDGLQLPFTPTCTSAIILAPLWFVLVFVPLTLLSPLLARIWRTPSRWLLVAGVLAIAAYSDVGLLRGDGSFGPNDTTIFLIPWFAGFAYARGDLQRLPRRVLFAVSAASLAAMVAAMLGPWSAELGRPTRTLITILEAAVSIPLMVAFRDVIGSWGATRWGAWIQTHVGNRMMSVFVWHQVAYAAVITTLLALDVSLAPEPDWRFWLQRIPIVAVSLLLLRGVLAATDWIEKVPVPSVLLRRQVATT